MRLAWRSKSSSGFFSVLEPRHARAFSTAASVPGIEIAASARFELDDIRAAILRAVDHDSVSAAAVIALYLLPSASPRRCEKVTLKQLLRSDRSEPQIDLANDRAWAVESGGLLQVFSYSSGFARIARVERE